MQRSTEPPETEPTSSLARPVVADEEGAYGWRFWCAYGNNLAMMLAVSLLFRYSDFVRLVGGTDSDLGWIVGLGTCGSILVRLAQGMGIDRYGARRVWLSSVALFAISCAAHLTIDRCDTPAVYLVRLMLAAGIAGTFGASITFISRTAPPARTAEVVGTLGTSGFLGQILGTQWGDFLCRHVEQPDRGDIDRIFLSSTTMACVALLCAAAATWGQTRPEKRRRPHLPWILRRYHPGILLLVSVAMGFGITVPQYFVRPFAASLGIATIGTFFLVYSLTAFTTRLSIRRLPELLGIRRLILVGMLTLVLGLLAYVPAARQWHLLLPAVVGGVAHALLFPAVVAGGSTRFPPRHRGVGTTLMLATFDVGVLVGSPLAGMIPQAAERIGWAGYPSMFAAVALLMAVVGCAYWKWGSREDGPPPR